MYRISVKGMFSAAHHLKSYRGKCENLHGHNWHVEAEVESEKLDKSGMVVDFIKLRGALEAVLKTLDHTCLNKNKILARQSPSSERIAEYIFNKLVRRIAGARLVSVSVWETPGSRATYYEKSSGTSIRRP